MNNPAIVLTRSGSTRVKNKNIRNFYNSRSLIQIVLEKIKLSDKFAKIVSATNSQEIIDLSRQIDVDIFRRKDSFCHDSSSSIKALEEVLFSFDYSFDAIYLFQCTSPFIKVSTIRNFVKYAENYYRKNNFVITTAHVSKEDIWYHNSKRIFKDEPRRQQDRDGFLIENSAIYRIPVQENKLLFDLDKFHFFKIDSIEGFDINTQFDWDVGISIAKNYL